MSSKNGYKPPYLGALRKDGHVALCPILRYDAPTCIVSRLDASRGATSLVLNMLSSPQAVAVIGASRTPGKLGHGVLNNIVQHGYMGAAYPINPRADEILGLKCYPSVLDVPSPIDLAVILIPSAHVAQVRGDHGV